MRVVITGATGNVGTSVIDRLVEDPQIDTILGVARRRPSLSIPKVEWHQADIATANLQELFNDADAIIHLAWIIQPSHSEAELWTTNVLGSHRVFQAAAAAGVSSVLYASSVGAYGSAADDTPVDESFPVDSIPTSFYSRHKAEVEWLLNGFEKANPSVRVVRFRPALIFKREAATGVHKLFLGPLIPRRVMRRGLLPLFPVARELTFQAVHSNDVAAAFHLALHTKVRGPFNLHADPTLSMDDVREILDATRLPVRPWMIRAAAAASWRLHLQPTPEGWVDMGLEVPVMSSHRASKELGWEPAHSSRFALEELIHGMGDRSDYPTPPLSA